MNTAQCRCGAISLSLPEPSKLIVACHCIDCQRRTGAPFSVGAFYPAEAVIVSGTAKAFTRDADSGGKVRSYFCSHCGATVYWEASNLPAMIGVAVGAMADPRYPEPVRSVFEQSKHAWVEIGGAGVEHFPQGSLQRNRPERTMPQSGQHYTSAGGPITAPPPAPSPRCRAARRCG